ncbi:MAG: hypothetical protein IPO40_05640 [Fibrobacteres bacterium]|nr:hypothetical protein [Fibrobacterota bacterium]
MGDETVLVRFWDAGEQTMMGESRMPAERLPETFSVETELDMSSGKFLVVKAEPAHKAEFQERGILDLYLQRVETMDPSQILFSLPTIEDTQPDSQAHPLSEQGYSIHEDEWRQLEFVATSFSVQVDAECEQIRAVRAQAAVGPGFKRIHLRQAIPVPLRDAALTLEQLVALVGEVSHRHPGFSIHAGRMVTDSFAFKLASGTHLFGTTGANGRITALCLAECTSVEPWMESLCRTHGLILVQWTQAQRVLG